MADDKYILSFKTPAASSFIFMHDPSAVISKNGKIIAGIEEERLSRIKHASNVFPIKSIKFCLSEAGIDLSDIDAIIIPDDPDLFKRDLHNLGRLKRANYKWFLLKEYKELIGPKDPSATFMLSSDKCKKVIYRNLIDHFGDINYPPIEFLSHHLCHAASCFYTSGFNDASIITIDGVGDFDSTVIWSWNGENLQREIGWKLDNSLGHFYGAFTIFLGYRLCNGESKVMGLAPYGEKNKDIFDIFDEIIKTDVDGYDVTEISIPLLFGNAVAVKRIEDLFGVKRRLPNQEFTKEHKDIAFALQYFLEKICMNLVRKAIEITGSHNVCLSGGVALNCKMNKKIMEMPEVDNIFIQPVANDAGCALGAVLESSRQRGFDVFFKMTDNYFGLEYDNATIENILKERKISFSKLINLGLIAKQIADGKFIGWFQGKMEMGPRALGNRSILADPRRNDLKDKLNDFVKHRERWRPYAPSVLEEFADEYIKNYSFSPFMIKTFDLNEKYTNNMEAVIHPKDKTTRPHVVYKDTNPRYYNLIKEFWKITGLPLILNTSFNDHGEPIVCSPQDALKTFYGTGLDILVLNDYVIQK